MNYKQVRNAGVRTCAACAVRFSQNSCRGSFRAFTSGANPLRELQQRRQRLLRPPELHGRKLDKHPLWFHVEGSFRGSAESRSGVRP